jgi:hypothetical protein
MTLFRTGRVCCQLVAGGWLPSIAMYWCVIRSFQTDRMYIEATLCCRGLIIRCRYPVKARFDWDLPIGWVAGISLTICAKYDVAQALAMIVTAHLTYYLLTTALGIIGLWQLGESFGHLGRTLTRWSAGAMALCQKA